MSSAARRTGGRDKAVARIGILTLHFHINYGGIIQAAALYRFLEDNGFEPVLLRKEPENQNAAGRMLRNLLRHLPGQNIGGVREREKARALHHPFIRRFLPNRTPPCHNSRELRAMAQRERLSAVVVGSDQVWRTEYHQDQNALVYFLDFVPPSMRKVSYAASFGHSEWRYPDKTEAVAALLGGFDAVSVRERSGVEICRNDLACEQCALVIDPTLLVDPRLYAEATAAAEPGSAACLVDYVLDRNAATERAHALVAEALGGKVRAVRLHAEGKERQVDIGRWLRAFMDAEFVITDSYHGTIFAILFGKRFVTLGNRVRGLDRFTTLLDSLGLSDRLILDHDLSRLAGLVAQPVDYLAVQPRLNALREQSRDFLIAALSPS